MEHRERTDGHVERWKPVLPVLPVLPGLDPGLHPGVEGPVVRMKRLTVRRAAPLHAGIT
ncbi:hypothetical protein ACFYRC_01705 [Streptomyces sp. NPDC005279]|uniref:hypothetical protein n=1 Tax=Streptomyces sp. NPDC005279 TaxID=3364712 RepID=UPI003682AD03